MKLFTSVLATLAAQTTLTVAAPVETVPTISKRFDINSLLADLLGIFPLNVIVNDLQDFLVGALQDLANELGIQTTQDAGTACATVTILYARGTDEPGNIGVIVLPAFSDAVQSRVPGGVAVQGTNNYAANITGFLDGGDQQGTQQLASDITSTLARCPSTKLVVSGYSQGGQLVHKAADIVGAAGMAQVSSVVIFGDPLNGQPVTGAETKTKVVCHDGDDVCEGGDLVLLPHLTYALDAGDAADFVIQQAGL